MKKMLTTGLAVVLLGSAAVGGGYWFGRRGAARDAKGESAAAGAGGTAGENEEPVAIVQVTPVRQGTISEQVTSYGTIVAPAADVRVISVPFEARVSSVLVAPGETLAAGESLVEVEASAATQLAFVEAQNALAAARRDLDLVRQRFEQHLATNTELATAQTAERTAEVRLQNLEQSGAAGPRQLKTDVPGVVSKVDVQTGQVVPAGGALVEVAAQNRIAARLGVDPEDAASLRVGQPVTLHRVADPVPRPIAGTIRLVGRRVDPASHLVEVMVQPASDSSLLLDDYISALLTRATDEGLLVPRDAVLPDEAGEFEVFTVREGKAVKHAVRVGVENDREVQVIADDLKAGEPAVVVGNLELEDGMAVRTQPAPAPTTVPEDPVPETGPAPASQPAPTRPPATAPAAGGAS